MAKQKFKLLPPQPKADTSNLTSSATGETNAPAAETKPLTLMKDDVKRPIEFKYIPRKNIRFHKDNDYPQEDIEKLAESILTFGLIHPMEAYYSEEDDAYIIESGERRTRAIDFILQKYLNSEMDRECYEYQCFQKNVKGYVNGYPLTIVRPVTDEDGNLSELDTIDSLLRLDIANIEVRSIDPLEKARFIQRRKELLKRRNELLPTEAKININEQLSQDTGMQKRTVMHYAAIAEKLIPELQEEFKKNHITLKDGSAYAQLSEDEQRYILQCVQNKEKISREQLAEVRQKLAEQQSVIDEKTAVLEQMKREKEQVEKDLRQKISDEKLLEQKLREEIAADNNASIVSLQQALEAKKSELAKLETLKNRIQQEHKRKISSLEKELQTLKERPAITEKEQQILRLKTESDANIKNLKNTVSALSDIYEQLKTSAPEEAEKVAKTYRDVIAVFDK